jgi:hypothetical protein
MKRNTENVVVSSLPGFQKDASYEMVNDSTSQVLTRIVKCIFCNICPGVAAGEAKSKIDIGE